MLGRNHFLHCFTSRCQSCPQSHFSVWSSGLKGKVFANKSLQRSQSPPLAQPRGHASSSSHSTVCSPTGEEMGSFSGCRDERRQKTTSLKLCGVGTVCHQSLGGPGLLLCFKAWELAWRDVILLGSQRKFPGARGEVLPQEWVHREGNT